MASGSPRTVRQVDRGPSRTLGCPKLPGREMFGKSDSSGTLGAPGTVPGGYVPFTTIEIGSYATETAVEEAST